MSLYSELKERLIRDDVNNIISVTGGGGKTTFLHHFGAYLARMGYSVLLTTTTKIQGPERFENITDRAFTDEESALAYHPGHGYVAYYAEWNEKLGKCVSPRLEVLSELSRRYDVTLIEADGSRHLPLKMHTRRDPVILLETTAFVSIMGADGIGKRAGDVTFGLENDERIVDRDFLEYYFNAPEGTLKGFRENCPGLVIFNRADSAPVDRDIAAFDRKVDILVASEEQNELYLVL